MLYLLIIFIIICLIGIKFKKNDSLEHENTTMINGLFVGLIFFHHFSEYINYHNNIYELFFTFLGQMIVATFLFFSGYGIYESIKNKKDYLKTFPKKRFLKLFLNFALAIILFIISNLIINEEYNLKTILLSFTGFTSIGNSNWYMFATFYLYFCTIISFRFLKNKKISLIMMFILSIIYVIVMVTIGKNSAWYNTILCFPGGMLFSYYKDKLLKTNKSKLIVLFTSIILFILTLFIRHNYWVYEIRSILFVISIIMILQYIKLDNFLLKILGKYTFEIYILQRISFRLLKGLNLNIYLYFISSIILTIIICIIYKFIQKHTIQKVIN